MKSVLQKDQLLIRTNQSTNVIGVPRLIEDTITLQSGNNHTIIKLSSTLPNHCTQTTQTWVMHNTTSSKKLLSIFHDRCSLINLLFHVSASLSSALALPADGLWDIFVFLFRSSVRISLSFYQLLISLYTEAGRGYSRHVNLSWLSSKVCGTTKKRVDNDGIKATVITSTLVTQ